MHEYKAVVREAANVVSVMIETGLAEWTTFSGDIPSHVPRRMPNLRKVGTLHLLAPAH